MGLRTTASPNECWESQFPLTYKINEGVSSYNLSFDEFQSHGLKPLHGTIFSEFLNPTFVAGQQIQTLTSSSSPSSSDSDSSLTANYYPNDNFNGKAVDEACFGMQEEQDTDEKHASFDVTSFEGFLAPAGASNLKCNRKSQPLLAVDPMIQERDGRYDHQFTEQHQIITLLRSNLPILGNGIGNTGFIESQEVPMEMNQNDENIDKSINRRHKRMIKNRESAARSRANKQVHINKLKEDVERLQARKEELLKRRDVDRRFCSNAAPQPRNELRRTSST